MQSASPNDNKNKPISNYAKYSGIGIQMVAIIGIFSFAGYKIDQYAGHQTKWVTAILALTGVFIAMYVVFRSVKE
ncbi:MAG: AtpZ/AtpI family protein [Mucilaginibacter sp.]|uniref:AtpZ/AtpI family protein n=1 Tax=Mucilaginibacter sp. TaxID=1882438 RepID=UPI0032654D44